VVFVAGAIATVLRHLLGLTTRRWLNLNVVRRGTVLGIAALLTVALEINQQAHSALLRTTSTRFPFAGVMAIMTAGAVIAVGIVMTVQHRRRRDARPDRRVTADRAGAPDVFRSAGR
jgi:hypothetical protein